MNGIDLFADNSTGIYRSTDYGASWTPIDSDLTELAVKLFYGRGPYLFCSERSRVLIGHPTTAQLDSS